MTETLGEYVKSKRNELRLTQEELAQRLENKGIQRTASTIAVWEAGRAEVPLEFINALAEALEESTPLRMLEIAGLLDNINGGDILRMLENASDEEVSRIRDVARVLLQKQVSK